VRALSGLPNRHAQILQLSLWDELTTPQIAQVLSCSENAVAIRLHRARSALRDRYTALLAGGGAS
jgi:RNA polymerase sigma-70 factor (ECF subfamily)